MTRTAIAVFSKTPESKQAKTRLRAGFINSEKVQNLHREFVASIMEQVARVPDCDHFVFWLPDKGNADLGPLEQRYPYAQHYFQKGSSFSARFSSMVQTLKERDCSNLIIVGSDCPKLHSDHIKEAKALLDAGHSVYGPAQRGGIYLLGFSAVQSDVDWNALFSEQNQHLAFKTTFPDAVALPPLKDVDLVEDLEQVATA